nr:Chain A, Competence-stimulating peptide type 1 [Streptococcus pneumoniae]
AMRLSKFFRDFILQRKK